MLLSKHPDVIISTPGRILAQLQSGNINLKSSLETLVIDEADLVFSFGFENDLKGIVDHLPSIYQVSVGRQCSVCGSYRYCLNEIEGSRKFKFLSETSVPR